MRSFWMGSGHHIWSSAALISGGDLSFWIFSLIPLIPSRNLLPFPSPWWHQLSANLAACASLTLPLAAHPLTCHSPVPGLTKPQSASTGPPSCRTTRIKKKELANQWTFQLGVEKRYVAKTKATKRTEMNSSSWELKRGQQRVVGKVPMKGWDCSLVWSLEKVASRWTKGNTTTSLPGALGGMKIACRPSKSYPPPRLSLTLSSSKLPWSLQRETIPSLVELFQKYFGARTPKALITIYIVALDCVSSLSSWNVSFFWV